MSQRKNVKEALAKSFGELLLVHPFEKITIKMITDNIGVIRPTFYNHFIDKYEVLEWICYKDIFEDLGILVDQNMFSEAIEILFHKIEDNKAFYLKAVKVQGQNAFNDIFCKQITTLIETAFESLGNSLHTKNKVFTPRLMSTYYAQGITYIVEQWLIKGLSISASDMTKAYYVLATTSMEEMIEKGYREEDE